MDHRRELGEFLRARRAALDPEHVGLPADRRRRTPGLRREEVALLAGLSVTWYTWLEQGRRINASRDVLRAVARALQLDDAGCDYLLGLADPGPQTAQERPLVTPSDVPTALKRLIDRLDPAPAYVLGPHWEFAAWNAAEERLYPPLASLDGIERSLMWVLFADPFTRELIVDWDLHARQALAEFRAATGVVRNGPVMSELVERLSKVSDEFAEWWAEYDVSMPESRLRRFRHPDAGVLTFEYQLLVPAEWPELRVVTQLPVPGDDSAERLAVRHHVI